MNAFARIIGAGDLEVALAGAHVAIGWNSFSNFHGSSLILAGALFRLALHGSRLAACTCVALIFLDKLSNIQLLSIMLTFDGADIGATRYCSTGLAGTAIARVSVNCLPNFQRSSSIIAIACIVSAYNLSKEIVREQRENAVMQIVRQ